MTGLTVAGFILAVVGVLLTAFGIWLALRSRNRRRLSWEARTSPMIGSGGRLRGELDILFHGQVVDDPHAVVIEFRNTGDAPLRADDFIDPLTVHFEPGAHWMMAAVVADPDERAVSFSKEGGEVSFRPELLQPTESVYVHGLFDGDPGAPAPSGRVAGVGKLEPLRRELPISELLGRTLLEVGRNLPWPFPTLKGPDK